MDLNKILGQESFFMVNKEIMKKVKCNGAVLLSYLIGKEKYFKEKGGLVKTKFGADFFYLTIEKIQEEIGLTRDEQKTSIKLLEKELFIEKIKVGVPARNHFRILNGNIFNFLKKSGKSDNKFAGNPQTGENSQKKDISVCGNTSHQFVGNPQTIYKDNKNNILKNNNNSKELLEQAQKKSSYKILENKNIENSEDELEKKGLEQESLKNSAGTEIEKVYGKVEINEILAFLKKTIGISDFKESQKMQRIFGKHILNLGQKIGKEDFIFRLKNILQDGFKAKNCNSLKYLYGELKSFIHSPILEKKSNKTVTFG